MQSSRRPRPPLRESTQTAAWLGWLRRPWMLQKNSWGKKPCKQNTRALPLARLALATGTPSVCRKPGLGCTDQSAKASVMHCLASYIVSQFLQLGETAQRDRC